MRDENENRSMCIEFLLERNDIHLRPHATQKVENELKDSDTETTFSDCECFCFVSISSDRAWHSHGMNECLED